MLSYMFNNDISLVGLISVHISSITEGHILRMIDCGYNIQPVLNNYPITSGFVTEYIDRCVSNDMPHWIGYLASAVFCISNKHIDLDKWRNITFIRCMKLGKYDIAKQYIPLDMELHDTILPYLLQAPQDLVRAYELQHNIHIEHNTVESPKRNYKYWKIITIIILVYSCYRKWTI